MYKLIRDRIASIPWLMHSELKEHIRPVRGWVEHRDLLVTALLGESAELIGATTQENRTEEIGDIIDVLRGWAHIWGIDWAEVEQRRVAKNSERGGYTEGTVWEW